MQPKVRVVRRDPLNPIGNDQWKKEVGHRFNIGLTTMVLKYARSATGPLALQDMIMVADGEAESLHVLLTV